MALIPARARAAIAAAAVLTALLAYLRDPPWLIHTTSGLAPWRTDSAGARYRPMGGHGSFFVPSDATAVTLRVRARFDSPADWPITATFSVDDRTAARVVLTDDGWRSVTLPLRRPSGRRVRRIDIRADRTRGSNHALDVGEVEVAR